MGEVAYKVDTQDGQSRADGVLVLVTGQLLVSNFFLP